MIELEPFPKITLVLKTWLETRFPDLAGRVGLEWPGEDVMPFARLEKIGGTRTKMEDYPVVDIELLLPALAGGDSLVEALDAALLSYPMKVGSVVLDSVVVNRSMTELPWDNGAARRFAGTYSFTVRR
jgi:hypothetical protein